MADETHVDINASMIIAEALSWIGTPYKAIRHVARMPDVIVWV